MHRIGPMAVMMAVAALVVATVTVAAAGQVHAAAAGHGQSEGVGTATLTVPTGDGGIVVQAAPTAQVTDEEDDDRPAWVNWLVGGFHFLTSIALIIAGWKVFTKAGRAGWLSLIPIVNAIVLLLIVGRPWWWIILYLIPIVGFIVWLVVSVDLAKAFGRSTAFGIVLIGLLNLIGMLILGFGEDRYTALARR